jgi:hypothetical protein
VSVTTSVRVRVYAADHSSWGDVPEEKQEIELKSYWNDNSGERVTVVVDGRERTVTARDLRAAITAVTAR